MPRVVGAHADERSSGSFCARGVRRGETVYVVVWIYPRRGIGTTFVDGRRMFSGVQMRRIASTTVALGLAAVAGLSQYSVPASANPHKAPDVLVSGQVLSTVPGSSGPADGATVFVSWTPDMATAQVGDNVEVVPVGSATTDADGNYQIDVAPDAQMESAASRNGGWVNFDVAVVDPELEKVGTATLSRELSDGQWQTPEPGRVVARAYRHSGELRAGEGPEAPSVPPAVAPELNLVLSANSRDASNTDLRTAARAARFGYAARDTYPPHCEWHVDGTPLRNVSVVEFHNAGNSDAKWTYGKSADSDVSGGYAYAGDGWGAKGTYHISNSSTSTVGKIFTDQPAVNAFGRTGFEWRDSHTVWSDGTVPDGHGCPYGPPGWTVGDKWKLATDWRGGVAMNNDLPGREYLGCSNSPQSDHRTAYPKNTFFTRNDQDAASISNGVDIGPISLSSKSGFSEFMDLHYDSLRGNGIWLCGTNYYPPTAGVIHAQDR